jgi:DNA polymerase III subunit beta
VRISCPKDDLLRDLQVVARGVSQRSSVQILSGVLIDAPSAEQPVELAATDMELSVRAKLLADVNEPGRVVVPGRLLLDIVRHLPPQQVVLSSGDGPGLLKLECGASQYSLHTYDPDDFPRLPEVDHGRTFGVERETFLQAAQRVLRAASSDDSRPVLTGVLVEFSGGVLTMAATDSYRMAVRTTPLEGGPPEDLTAIVPARALADLIRIAASVDGEKQLQIVVEENQVLFGTGDVWLGARRIEGQFPEFRRLLPETFEHEVSLPRAEFADVIARVEVLAGRSPLRLAFAPGELTVSAQTQEVGEGRESLPCDFRGEPLEIGFNPAFLREGVESIPGDSVLLKLITPLRPGLLTGGTDDYWYLIMPIRLAS